MELQILCDDMREVGLDRIEHDREDEVRLPLVEGVVALRHVQIEIIEELSAFVRVGVQGVPATAAPKSMGMAPATAPIPKLESRRL